MQIRLATKTEVRSTDFAKQNVFGALKKQQKTEAKCFWSFKSVIFEERIIMVDLTGKRVIVVGTGISGIGSAGLLEANGAIPVIYEGNTAVKESDVRGKLKAGSKAEIVIGAFTEEILENIINLLEMKKISKESLLLQ